MTTSTTSIDIMVLQAAYANLHTDQERDYFMQLYDDVICSFEDRSSYDADNLHLLVMRCNLWASGYDSHGTDQTSLGQFSGRVQQQYKHSLPSFFFFSSRRRHTRCGRDWSSDVCSSDLAAARSTPPRRWGCSDSTCISSPSPRGPRR